MTPRFRDRIDHRMAWRGGDFSKEDISSLIRCSFGDDRFYPGFFRQNASQAPPALAEGQRAQIETRGPKAT